MEQAEQWFYNTFQEPNISFGRNPRLRGQEHSYTHRTVRGPQNGQGIATNKNRRLIGKARVLVKRATLEARQCKVHQVSLSLLDQVIEKLCMELQDGQKLKDKHRGKFWTQEENL